jgi:23S rRNA pseudouridine1911/1915/1917 synthase
MDQIPDHPSRLVVPDDVDGERLDQFLSDSVPGESRSHLHRLIREGRVSVSRGRAKPSLEVTAGLVVEIDWPALSPATPEPEALPLVVIHDDEDLVVVNKPAGMVVHPGAGHATGTLVNALLHHVKGLSGIGGTERPGIVHRLDRGTSGVMVVAKHDRAHRALSNQFEKREVEKEYLALVWGRPKATSTIERPIGRDPKHRQRMSTRSRTGRPATTHILEIEPLDGVSLVRVSIATGRTHQIRVHLSEAGYPIVGDALYNGVRKLPPRLGVLRSIDGPCLHAARLRLSHPGTGERMTFEAPVPTAFATVIETLRRGAAGNAGNTGSAGSAGSADGLE